MSKRRKDADEIREERNMKINLNMSAVITNKQLKRTENRLSASMERLSTGLKLNHASDNPAGMAISNKMKAQIDALDQADSNASDAISVLQIADGALNEVTSILQRMRELAVQAANGTNTYEERTSIQKEIIELQKEVDRISEDTEFNTKTLLDGSSDVRVYAEEASRIYVSDTVSPAKYKINVEELGKQATVDLSYPTNGVEGKFKMNGVEVELTAGMTQNDYMQVIRNAAEEAGCVVEATGNGVCVQSEAYGSAEGIALIMSADIANAFGIAGQCEVETLDDGTVNYIYASHGEDAKVSLPTDLEESNFTTTTTVSTQGNRIIITDSNGFEIDFMLDANYQPDTTDVALNEAEGNYTIEVTDIGSMTIQIGANESQTMDVRISEVSAESLYVDTVDVSKSNGAGKALVTLDDAIAKLSAVRSRIGAFQNRLEYASSSLATSVENVTAAYSNLTDTDMAEEMTEYTHQNILDQAAVSVLAQANELPEQVLSLLR